jgi:hypothetical protein
MDREKYHQQREEKKELKWIVNKPIFAVVLKKKRNL